MSRYATHSFLPLPTTNEYQELGVWQKPEFWHANLTIENEGPNQVAVKALGSSDRLVYPVEVMEETLIAAGESIVHQYNLSYVPFIKVEAKSAVANLHSTVRVSGIAFDIEALRLETPPQDRVMPRDFFMYDELYTKIGVGKAPVWFTSQIVSVQGFLSQAATGAPVLVGINVGTPPATPVLVATLVIPAGEKHGMLSGLEIPLVYGDYITADVVGIGTSYPGKDLSVSVLVER